MSATPIVVGLSFRTAPMALLERAAVDAQARKAMAAALLTPSSPDDQTTGCVTEVAVLSTCNRLEVYASVTRFHNGLAALSAELAEQCAVPLSELTPHLYVHYENAAVEHLFAVTAGLDSMAVGEQQILGQVRAALRESQEAGTVGRVLMPLLQQGLRVGKRVHAETGLDRAGTSLVAAALEEAARILGGLHERTVLVIGAGAMGGLAVAGVQRANVGRLIVLSRTQDRAERLAAAAGGQAVPASDLENALVAADVVLACTGAVGHVVDLVTAANAAVKRRAEDRPAQVYLDLAMPRDIDPAVAELDAVHLVDLERLGEILADHPMRQEIQQARAMVAAEVTEHLSALEAQQVAPTVIALRSMAQDVVSAELERMHSRLGPEVPAATILELEQTVHRVVEKLLHTPTVRVKELATAPNGSAYATALRMLFDLDLDLPASVTGHRVADVVEVHREGGDW